MKKKTRAPAPALLAMALASAWPAQAQQAADKFERIEVTGSRIATTSDLESASPIAILKGEELRIEGFPSLEQILNGLPQFVGDQGSLMSNGATGTATADLRGLGAQRTLVLLNGRRMPMGSPFALSPDLNQIPPQLIQRVEILTGGASAVYGSDAIAGVVNFILNDRFEGVQGDVAYDFYAHRQKSWMADLVRARNFALPDDKWGDGATTTASLTLGGNFVQDKGNATVSLRYLKSEALLQSERDYSACTLTPSAAGNVICGGSGVTNPVHVIDPGLYFPDISIDPRERQDWTLTSIGRVRPFVRDADSYNFAPLNYYQRPSERYGFNASINYDLTHEARAYAELGFHDDRTVAQLAVSGLFGVEALVRYENPLLSQDWRNRLLFRNPDGTAGTGPGTMADVLVLRRNVEGGGRQDSIRNTSYREVIGLKGQAGAHWDYDVFFQTSRVIYQERYSHDFSLARATRALDVLADPATGAPVCASVLNGTDRSCVPYNVWTLDGVTNAALNYLEVPAFQRAQAVQQVAGGTITANLGDYGVRLPRTGGGVEIVLGVERRTEKLDFQADAEFQSGDLTGQDPVRDVHGGVTVKDFFAEARIPVLDMLALSGSYRHSSYDSGQSTNTYGVGFTATPARFARIRGSYQRAVRAANVRELFDPQIPTAYGFQSGGDPCAGTEPSRSLIECQRTGVPAAVYGHIPTSPFQDYPSTSGGNPDLKPETANTYTLGTVLTPTRDFSATIDYFDIRIEDTISGIDPNTIFEQCLETGDPVFCSNITRDPVAYTLWLGRAGILAINQNIGRTRVSGVDVGSSYRWRFANAHLLAVDFLGSYLLRRSVEAFPGAPVTECAGTFGNGDCSYRPMPRWRHRLRATWQPPSDFELAATWRYTGPTTNGDPILADLNPRLASASYLDLAGSWNITKRLTLRGGVNNLLDRDPPLLIGGTNGNTFAQSYDVLGRHFFVNMTAKF
jgi:iron complex outermembrane receptor protein